MKDIDTATEWYEQNRPLYESLAHKVENIITENLEQKGIQYHSVTSRGKSLESFNKKAQSEKYTDPVNEIKDMAGIRVITYLESDVTKAVDILEDLFDIDKKNSLDQSQLLGSDKLGYRSVHYVAKFNKKRCRLPEYKPYENLPFEIQIRSILQHAWAEIEHDRNYKFTGKLPTQLERRFYLISGMLECADREFVAIAQEIDKYKNTVVEDLIKGDLNIEINTTSLREYLAKTFNKLIEKGILIPNFGTGDVGATVVEELHLFGISNVRQLDKIIPEDLQDNIIMVKEKTNFAGIIRSILLIDDLNKYFKSCWRKTWQGIHSESLALLKNYNIKLPDLKKYMKTVDIL